MHQALPASRSVIALLTDFGLGDGDVGVMKGVIAGIALHAHIIDITHDIAPQIIAAGAWVLASSYRYFPSGTVFVCVVDPGVGSTRSAIAVHAGTWFFVGPDNGLFSYIYAGQSTHEAVILNNPAYHLPQVSPTFHGRDIFAPVGAYLASGVALCELGEQVDPTMLQRLNVRQPVRNGSHIEAYILHIDHFGNLITNIPLTLVPDVFTSSRVQLSFPTISRVVEHRRRFFAEGNDLQPFIYADSSGNVGVAVQNGNAAQTLGVNLEDSVILDLFE